MKAPFSTYLTQLQQPLEKLLALFETEYEYVSALATDSNGITLHYSKRQTNVSQKTLFSERGIVFRFLSHGQYFEYAIDHIEDDLTKTYEKIKKGIALQQAVVAATNTKPFVTGKVTDEPIDLFVEKECEVLPSQIDVETWMERFGKWSKEQCAKEGVLDCVLRGQATHISKMFLTKNRKMKQSYVMSEGMAMAIVTNGEKTEFGYEGVSGLKGGELFEEMAALPEKAVQFAFEVVNADAIVPGEYEIITTPEITGLIAHEAFGHGVEMDMFVKNRAIGKENIGVQVASEMVTMHEGALIAEDVTSYAFDDEGTLAGDVIEIDHGILKTGICDALSAVRLGTQATGNGKRQTFEHKVYTRMTNTIFDSGEVDKDDMIASVKHGYLLEGMQSGMEDPKHWGIQCILSLGREIKDGKLTGKVVSPVILTGYVPDLLKGISMVSKDRGVFGTGMCGKGHKEWVKVTDGGPYLKTKGRLG